MKRFIAFRTFGRVGGIILAILSVSAFFSWGVNALFTIRNVEVMGSGIEIAVDANRLPRNLLFFPAGQVAEELLKEYPLARTVAFKKRYPGTLVITVLPRSPFVIAGIGSETYTVDIDGVVLEKYPGKIDLPAIHIAMPSLLPGSKVSDPAITASMLFIRETRSVLQISNIVMVDTASLRAQAGSMSIVFPQLADIPALARTLQTMMTGFRIKGKLPTTIDVRFDKPVVTF